MTDRELKHMGRQGLIELLCQLKKENNALKERNRVLQEKLEEKSVKIADAGTLAEGSRVPDAEKRQNCRGIQLHAAGRFPDPSAGG